jgi:hypothetical protein
MDKTVINESFWFIRQCIEAKRESACLRRAALKDQMLALDNDLAELDVALKVVVGLAGAPPAVTEQAPVFISELEDDDESDEAGRPRRGEQRRLILETLNTQGQRGVTVTELHTFIKVRAGIEIQPNTLSVTLSRLKAKGLATLSGQNWFPADPFEEHGSRNEDQEDDPDAFE